MLWYLQCCRVHRSSITLHRHQSGLAGARVSLLHLQVTHQRRRLQVEQQALGRAPVDGKAERTEIRDRPVPTGSLADRNSGRQEVHSPGPQPLDLCQQLELTQVTLRHLHHSSAQLAAAPGQAVLHQASSVITHLHTQDTPTLMVHREGQAGGCAHVCIARCLLPAAGNGRPGSR